MIFNHFLPLMRVTLLVGEPFCIKPIRQDHRISAVFDGLKNIRPKDDAVVHRNGLMPGDTHTIPYLRACLDLW